MINNPNQSIQITWQALLWRLLLTLLLLLALAGPGLTLFKTAISRPGARALPTLTQDMDQEGQGMEGGELFVP